MRLSARVPLVVVLRIAALCLGLGTPLNGAAKVVINEVFYNAPGDQGDVQWIELANTSKAAVDLGGWKLSEGLRSTLPAGTSLPAGGYLVVARNRPAFAAAYPQIPIAAEFDGKLKSSGEVIALLDAAGKVQDRIRYRDKAPWPTAADGETASLERISPDADGELAENWAPSRLSENPDRPGGSPGKPNGTFAAQLPPVIVQLTTTPVEPTPDQPVEVQVRFNPAFLPKTANALFQDVRPGSVSKEATVELQPRGSNTWSGIIPARKSEGILRIRASAIGPSGARRIYPHPNEPTPAQSLYVHRPLSAAKIAQAWVVQAGPERLSGERNYNRSWNSPQKPPAPIQGTSAFVWVGSNGAPATVFDFVTVQERTAGWKVHLHKSAPLDGMTTLNFTFEDHERFVVAEPLAYGLHRDAGIPAARTEYVRLNFDGRPLGYHLMIEQPNKAFLKRHGHATDGHLYKIQWFGRGIAGQHEKKTRLRDGHKDLIALVQQLNQLKDKAQWELIRTNFNVEEVLTYFAVSSLTAYWDGFFNNYFTYHDVRTGRWELYPWDLDKALGYHDAVGGGVFAELPLSYGAEGDAPPGWRGKPPKNFFEANSPWWRPGGWFSRGILANPTAKTFYHARIRELLDTIFTEEAMGRRIDAIRNQLQEEVRYRATLQGEDPKRAERRLESNLKLMRQFVTQRRAYLLAQPEILTAGPFNRAALK